MVQEFSCKFCGHCCHGQGGIIVSNNDLTRLSKRLNLTEQEVTEQFCIPRNGKRVIRTNETNFCVFFEKDKGCLVHDDKPNICKAWPFFRGNLVDNESLALAKDYCPGIPQNMELQDFLAQGIAYIEQNHLCSSGDESGARALAVADVIQQSTHCKK